MSSYQFICIHLNQAIKILVPKFPCPFFTGIIYGLEYVTDETNLLDTYSRNKIRLNVVPVLREVNSKASLNNTVSTWSDRV